MYIDTISYIELNHNGIAKITQFSEDEYSLVFILEIKKGKNNELRMMRLGGLSEKTRNHHKWFFENVPDGTEVNIKIHSGLHENPSDPMQIKPAKLIISVEDKILYYKELEKEFKAGGHI